MGGDGQFWGEGGHQQEILGLVSQLTGSVRRSTNKFPWPRWHQIEILTEDNSCLANTFLISIKLFLNTKKYFSLFNPPQEDETRLLIVPDDVSQHPGADLQPLARQSLVGGWWESDAVLSLLLAARQQPAVWVLSAHLELKSLLRHGEKFAAR